VSHHHEVVKLTECSSEIPLNDRIYYLSQALVNAKSSSQSSERSNVEFVTDLEEKTEVAQVQVEVARAVREVRNLSEEQKKQLQGRLEAGLLTINEVSFAARVETLAEIVSCTRNLPRHSNFTVVFS